MHNVSAIASALVLLGQQPAEGTSSLQGLLWVFGLVACIVFLVGIGMSYRTWRIPMLLLVPAIIIAAGFFLGYAVVALKAQQQWGQTNNALEVQVKKVEALNEELEKGVFDKDKLVRPGVKQLNNAVVDILRDRGRMWTGAQPSAPEANGDVQVTVVEPKEHQIRPKTLLHVFEERPTGGSYVGIFRVSAVLGGDKPMEEPMAETKPAEEKKEGAEKKEGDAKDGEKADAEKKDGEKKEGEAKDGEKKDGEKKDGDMKAEEKPADKPAEKAAEPMAPAADGAKGPSVITLTPAWRISPRELERLKASTGPWTLYDKMPADDHALFADIDKHPYTKAPLPIDRAEAIRGMVPKEVAQEYIDDYQPAKDGQPKNRQFVRVKFIKDYTAPAQPIVAPVAEAPAAGGGGAGGAGGFGGGVAPADGAGGQNPPPAAPVQAGPLEYKAGAVAWMTPEAANELQVQGVVQLLKESRYERPLRDYAWLFDAEYISRERLANQIATLEMQNAALEVVYEKNVELVKRTGEEQTRLQNDLERYNFEKQTLDRHAAALAQQYQALGQKLKTLFLANQEMAAKIAELEQKAAAGVNRRAAAPPQALHVPPAGAASALSAGTR